MMRLKPVTPGALLQPLGIPQARLAKGTDLRLCRFFGLSNGYWLRAQAAHDTEVAAAVLSKALKKIKPWQGLRLRTRRTA